MPDQPGDNLANTTSITYFEVRVGLEIRKAEVLRLLKCLASGSALAISASVMYSPTLNRNRIVEQLQYLRHHINKVPRASISFQPLMLSSTSCSVDASYENSVQA